MTAPRVQHVRARRRLVVAALLAPAIVLGVVKVVDRLSSIDRALAAEGANAARGLVYELPRGSKLVVPIEPDSDLLRFVVSGYRRGTPIPLTPRHVRIKIDARGERSRSEVVELELPGIRTHITPEDASLLVADPLAFSFDVHDLGVGEATLTLEDALEIDGVLVRAYRREHLKPGDTSFRDHSLDPIQKDHLATWAWEPGWNELADVERDALLATRWRKIPAVRGPSGDLRSFPVAISAPPARPTVSRVGSLLGTVSVRHEERVAMVVRGSTTLRASSDPGIHLHATVRTLDGNETKLAGDGLLEVAIPDAQVRSVEMWSDEEAIVTFRTTDAGPVEWLSWATAHRVTASNAIELASPDAPRAVRVSMRRPVPRAGMPLVPIAVRVDVDEPTSRGKLVRTSRTFRAEVARARVDRYDGTDPLQAPTDRASFFVRLARGGSATIATGDGAPIDVTLAELDEAFEPEPLETRPMDTELSPFMLAGERTWLGFVPRLPSNAAAFAPLEGRPRLRLGKTIVQRPPPGIGAAAPAIAHLKHTTTRITEKDGRRFDAIDQPFEIDPDAARPLFVPVVFQSDEPTHVVLSIDIDPRHALRSGFAEHLTRTRSVDVPAGHTRTTFTIGDDLPPGRHRLRVESPSKTLTVLLPWASTRAVGPRWIGGAFEE
jgi:hypothetical protein